MNKKKLLIITVGKTIEPIEYCINKLKPDFIYFIHSDGTKAYVECVIKNCDLKENNYELRNIGNKQDFLYDSYLAVQKICNEIDKEDYKVFIDYTTGTSPMRAGVVVGSLTENCSYCYIGSTNEDGRDENKHYTVKSGYEKLLEQINPYQYFAVREIDKAKDFFNKNQFTTSNAYFNDAIDILGEENKKELIEVYKEIVEVYDSWDKFLNKINNVTINNKLKQILEKINSSSYLDNEIQKYPTFLSQINNNIKFLNKKLTSDGEISIDNLEYYLPDLLNNAKRRINEGKYDDAVARLYRSLELIIQIKLAQEGFYDENKISNKVFAIKTSKIKKSNTSVTFEVSKWEEYQKSRKTFEIPLDKSYRLGSALGFDFAHDYFNNQRLIDNKNKRNRSILAHGLNPINKEDADELYNQMVEYSSEVIPNLKKYMEMAKFPKFND